jgi:hypothetical protein
MTHPKLYHLVLLLCCAAIGLILGIYDPPSGRAADSSALERAIDRLLSVGFVVFSVLIILRQFWAIDGLIICFAVSIIDCLLFFHPELFPLTRRVAVFKVRIFWSVFVLLCQGTLIALLICLRFVFTTT